MIPPPEQGVLPPSMRPSRYPRAVAASASAAAAPSFTMTFMRMGKCGTPPPPLASACFNRARPTWASDTNCCFPLRREEVNSVKHCVCNWQWGLRWAQYRVGTVRFESPL
mmetsp:Transcript_5327/g.9595  ORF Transcript_5327/g.9595 Transcript_5327/m.9595 type:complete len:110 (-) Transcript_5327:46-375(-)